MLHTVVPHFAQHWLLSIYQCSIEHKILPTPDVSTVVPESVTPSLHLSIDPVDSFSTAK